MELFYSVPWSHGTLGFLVSADIRIIPAKNYVRLEYHPVQTFDDAVRVFKEAAEKADANEFVESLMYGENEAVIMTGTQTNEAEPDKVKV